MPKLWSETIQTHRRAVRDAALDAVASLVAQHGLTSVTMSRVAEQSGIGRATLYKYFPDAQALLAAWHERQIADHLQRLTAIRSRSGTPAERLEAVLEAYAVITHEHPGTEPATLLHQGDQVHRAQRHLLEFLQDLLTEGAHAGEIRDDVPPEELATYCLHALTAGGRLPSKAAVHRLVTVTLAGLRPLH